MAVLTLSKPMAGVCPLIPAVDAKPTDKETYTAIGFGLSTDQWYAFIKDDAPLAAGAPSGIARLIVFGGGYPITKDGQIIGGIGVSGGHYTQDMEVAQAGLAVLTQAGG